MVRLIQECGDAFTHPPSSVPAAVGAEHADAAMGRLDEGLGAGGTTLRRLSQPTSPFRGIDFVTWERWQRL